MKPATISLIFLSVVLLCAAVFFASGGSLRVVMSNSMSPVYQAGDVLLVAPLPQDEIRPGKIVSFWTNSTLITHRVIEVRGGVIITKGDNSANPDSFETPFSRVEGAPVLHIPYLGHLLLFIRTPLGWFAFVILPIIWIIGSTILSTLRGLKRSSPAGE